MKSFDTKGFEINLNLIGLNIIQYQGVPVGLRKT